MPVNMGNVRLVIDFNGFEIKKSAEKVFEGLNSKLYENGVRLGQPVERWEVVVHSDEVLPLVQKAQSHPDVFRVQETKFANPLSSF